MSRGAGSGVAEPPGVAPGGVTVELERPDAVEALGLAGGGVLGAQHGGAFRERWGVAPLSHRPAVQTRAIATSCHDPPKDQSVARPRPPRSRERSVRAQPCVCRVAPLDRKSNPSGHRPRARSRRARISASSSIRVLKNRGWIAFRSRDAGGVSQLVRHLQDQVNPRLVRVDVVVPYGHNSPIVVAEPGEAHLVLRALLVAVVELPSLVLQQEALLLPAHVRPTEPEPTRVRRSVC